MILPERKINGYQAETLWYNTTKLYGGITRKSSKKEDMFQHIDYFTQFPNETREYSYDIKTIKGIARGENSNQNIIWLEFFNIIGKDGWLKSPTLDRIAFLRNDGFHIIDREKLYLWAIENIPQSTPVNFIRYKTLYTRENKKDVIAYIYYNDIQHLVSKIIKTNKDELQYENKTANLKRDAGDNRIMA